MIRVVSLFCGLGCADYGLYAAADELGIDLEVVDAIDSWDWAGATKTQIGQMVANSWPLGLSKAVGKAILEAIR